MPTSDPSGHSQAGELLQPTPLLAVAIVLVNDHLLKGSGLLPAAVTGKLSDLAGLFFFPILVVVAIRGVLAAVGVTLGLAGERRLAALAATLTATGFLCLKLWPGFNAALEPWWGVNVLDPLDLLALPMVGLSWAWLGHHRRARCGATASPGFAQRCAIAIAALTCVGATR